MMCSAYCPCPIDDAKPWTTMNETYLNSWNRTKVPATGISGTGVVGN